MRILSSRDSFTAAIPSLSSETSSSELEVSLLFPKVTFRSIRSIDGTLYLKILRKQYKIKIYIFVPKVLRKQYKIKIYIYIKKLLYHITIDFE